MTWSRKTDAPYVVVTDAGLWGVALTRYPFLQYLAPALGGEVIDVTTFCAAGPEFDPPITMHDIKWMGFGSNNGRPDSLLLVTRAIARQELFARYCQDDSTSAYVWTPHDWQAVTGTDWRTLSNAPTGSVTCRMNYRSLTGGALLQVLVDEGTDPQPLGTGTYNYFPWPSGGAADGFHDLTMHDALRRAGGGWSGGGSTGEVSIQWYHPGGGAYVPPEPWQDPAVVLPDGTGATLDQLEAKLDFLQLELRALAGRAFALDPTSMSGVGEHVSGPTLDGVGLLVSILGRPGWATSWRDDPDRYPRLASLTLSTEDGSLPSITVEHESTVILPLPLGVTAWSLRCTPPMTGSVTLYRPLAQQP